MTGRLSSWLVRAGGNGFPAAALVLAGLLLFPSAGQDDTHITCWPAYTLSHFGQILNYNGERVEQSSSLLQVLLLAALHTLTGANVVTLAKLASIAAGVASLVTLSTLVGRVASRSAGIWAASIAALSTPIVYWSFSGMETSLVSLAGLCLMVTAGDYLSEHPHASTAKLAAALAAFVSVRPEAPLLMAATLGTALAVAAAASRLSMISSAEWATISRRGPALVLLGGAVCIALFAFRWAYFGDFWPQPVAAKFSGVSWRSIVIGLHYVKAQAWNSGVSTAFVTVMLAASLLVTLAVQVRTRTLNLYILLSALFACGSLAFVITSSGDWMPGGRFLAHFLPVAVAFVPFALRGTTSRPWALPLIATVLMAAEVAAALGFARTGSTSLPLWAHLAGSASELNPAFSWFERHSRINVRDTALIGALDTVIAGLASEKHEPVVILSGQMGMVSYHIAMRRFGRVRFVDRHGLVERSLTGCFATRVLPRDTGGLVISAAQYLDSLDELEQPCRLARPDVVFDIGSWSSSRIAAFGYGDVYQQRGTISTAGTRLTGGTVLADAFIAVNRQQFPSPRSSGDGPAAEVSR